MIKRVKCPKCKHEFYSRSEMDLISCSNCLSKFKRLENVIPDDSIVSDDGKKNKEKNRISEASKKT